MIERIDYTESLKEVIDSDKDYINVISIYTEAQKSLNKVNMSEMDKMVIDKWGRCTLEIIKRIADINNSR